MSDIVERLRKGTCIGGKPMDALAISQGMADAADEIDRLEIDRDAWRLAFKDMVELKTQAVQRADTAEDKIDRMNALIMAAPDPAMCKPDEMEAVRRGWAAAVVRENGHE